MSDARPSPNETRKRKAAEIRHLLETEGAAVHANTSHFNEQRYEAVAGVENYEELRERARELKEEAIEDLPELIARVRERVAENGGSVYLADDAEDANRYVEEVVGEAASGEPADESTVESADGTTVVKSKSMTTEELELNEHLEAAGAAVHETDLGEFVIQVADEAPSHLVGPSLHKSSEDIAELFSAHFDPEEPLETPEQLTAFARDYLGERIREADVGITGANFVLADSGSIVLVTNEGNARKCAVTPDTHVAVAGVEKLLPSADELAPFIDLIGRAATGQDIPQYVSTFTPPVDSPSVDFSNPETPGFGHGTDGDESDVAAGDGAADREFHLVLVDNGRMEMRADEDLRETLYCIRCGACANSCANFQHVGGHAFGGETYTGGIATGWEAGVHGQDAAAEFNDLCTGCSRCVNACPVKIDIPWINTVVRDRINRGADPSTFDPLVEGLTPDDEPGGLDLQKRLFGNVETLARLGSATAPLSNWLADTSPVRGVLERVAGVDRRRDLPEFQRETLVDWFENRRPRAPNATAERQAVLYPDLYTNHVNVERGKAAVRTLEALGVHVELADPVESGRAPFSQGMVATARNQAESVAASLDPYLEAGFDVVVVEPSDIAMFEREYEKLLDEETAERIADASYEVMEYVYGLLENGADAAALAGPGDAAGGDDRLAYHSHCQQRTLDLAPYTEAVLSDLGYDLETSDVECCGMAGSFGYKSQYYDLAMDVGESLRADLDAEGRQLVASGTSCGEQLTALFQRETVHPVQVVTPT